MCTQIQVCLVLFSYWLIMENYVFMKYIDCVIVIIDLNDNNTAE